jgi:ubiquinone/menaquinone biosynthesis C-methylase UbiE
MLYRLVPVGLLTVVAVAAQSIASEPARERWQHVDEIIKAAGIAGGSSVADVGAGDGFLTLRIAPIVGENGHIFAVDISDSKLQSLKQRVADAHFANVEIVKGDEGDPRLPAGQLDVVIILNSYHEMPRFREILAHIRESLKPGGRLLIAEPGPLPTEQTRAEQIARHHISSKFVAEEMAQAGFTILEQRERFAQIPEANWYSLVVGQLPTSEEDRVAEMKRRVIALLGLNSGETAADVGSGDGFYTIPLARFLGPSGKVYAEDISDGQLRTLKQHLGEEGLTNVEIIKGAADDPKLPAAALDGVLIVNAYHEMTAHEAMLSHVISALKPHGVLVVMDGMWNDHESRPREEQVKFHELAPAVAKTEVEKAGFEIVEVRDPFIERAPDRDGKSRWWAIIARKPAR